MSAIWRKRPDLLTGLISVSVRYFHDRGSHTEDHLRLCRSVEDLCDLCLEAFYPRLNPWVIEHDQAGNGGYEALRCFIRVSPGMSSVLLSVGMGIEVSLFEP